MLETAPCVQQNGLACRPSGAAQFALALALALPPDGGFEGLVGGLFGLRGLVVSMSRRRIPSPTELIAPARYGISTLPVSYTHLTLPTT